MPLWFPRGMPRGVVSTRGELELTATSRAHPVKRTPLPEEATG